MQSEGKRLYEIDTLRGITIFFIVLFHINGSNLEKAFPNILKYFYTYGGRYGNTLFFMLSGFMIYNIYFVKIDNITLGKFIYNRISKFYITYICSSLVLILVQRPTLETLNYKNIILNICLITSGWIEDIYPFNVPCWFLSALILQYIIWYIVTKKNKENCAYIYIGLMLLGLSMQRLSLNVPFLYYHTGEAMVPFFEGCILCKVWKEKYLYVNKLIKIGTVTLLIFSMLVKQIGFFKAAGEAQYAWLFLITPLVILCALEVGLIKNFLKSKLMYSLFGTISTYIFFWHIPCLAIYNSAISKLQPDLSANRLFIGYIIFLYIFCRLYQYFVRYMQTVRVDRQNGCRN